MEREGTPALQHPGRAKLYNRTKLLIGITTSSFSFLYVIGVIATGFSRTLESWARSASGNPFIALLLFTVAVATGQILLTSPLGFLSGYILEQRYGLSNQTIGRWAWEHLKGMLIGLPFAAGGVLLFSICLERFGGSWWLPVGIVVSLVSVLMARLAPVLLFPLFYTFTPLEEVPLRDRISRLCQTAGVAFRGIYQFNLSKNTKKANAGFTGIGKSKRIILADTLVHDFTEEEIETVFAHELGHFVHHHLPIGVAAGIITTFLGLFVTARLYDWSLGLAGFNDPTQLAALPLLAIWLSLFGLVVGPLMNILSRRNERQADHYAVSTTGNATAFASALRKLAFMNLADPEPHPLVEFLFYSHPSITRRIREVEGGML